MFVSTSDIGNGLATDLERLCSEGGTVGHALVVNSMNV